MQRLSWSTLAVATALLTGVVLLVGAPHAGVTTPTPSASRPAPSPQADEALSLQGRTAPTSAVVGRPPEGEEPVAPSPTGSDPVEGPGDLVLVRAWADRDTLELGEPVRIHRIFENRSDRPIRVRADGWKGRALGEVGLTTHSGSRLYQPPAHHLEEALVAPGGRIENEIVVELSGAGGWTIEIPPEYQARGGRTCWRIEVSVIDRGDPRPVAAKAERLAAVIAKEDPDCPTCWSEAQKDLEGLGAAAVPSLRGWLREADVPHLRAVAAKILRPLVAKGEPGYEDLVAGMVDPDAHVRRMCVDAVGALPGRGAPDALLARLHDSDPSVRVATIETLARCEDPRVVPALVAALEDPDEYVRLRAAAALAKSKRNAAGIRVLVAALESDRSGNAYLVVPALEAVTGRSFGKARLPAIESSMDREQEASEANVALTGRWLEWWETEGRARYGG